MKAKTADEAADRRGDGITCPLCAGAARFFARDRRRRFLRCPACALVFADAADHLGRDAERAEYDLHRNDAADPAYRHFLSRLSIPLLSRLRAGHRGLDFGSGPGPTLAAMLAEAGMRMSIYDPFFAPQHDALAGHYDFVTCSEVVEHFNHPAESWLQLAALLAPGGWLGVMTSMPDDDVPAEEFLAWRYKDDLTHVSFYSLATMRWIAARLQLELTPIDRRVVLFQRPAGRLLP